MTGITRPSSTLDVEYVPMHNSGWNSYANISNKQNSTHVLAFNEPDKSDQANMSVEDVINAWPNLLASGLRLGSPAERQRRNRCIILLTRRMRLNLRVDFVAVHYYKNNWTANRKTGCGIFTSGRGGRFGLRSSITAATGLHRIRRMNRMLRR